MWKKLTLALYLVVVDLLSLYLVVFPAYAFQVSSSTTGYVRVAPQERGTFECDDSWIAKLSGLPALDAAKLDANRISQQFTGN